MSLSLSLLIIDTKNRRETVCAAFLQIRNVLIFSYVTGFRGTHFKLPEKNNFVNFVERTFTPPESFNKIYRDPFDKQTSTQQSKHGKLYYPVNKDHICTL